MIVMYSILTVAVKDTICARQYIQTACIPTVVQMGYHIVVTHHCVIIVIGC